MFQFILIASSALMAIPMDVQY